MATYVRYHMSDIKPYISRLQFSYVSIGHKSSLLVTQTSVLPLSFFFFYLVGGLTDSAIVGNDVNYLTHLSTWLKPVAQSKSSRWKRCWRASVDGWAASTFHGRCDNKGPTVTIIRVGGKYIFGGYTSLSWGKQFVFF